MDNHNSSDKFVKVYKLLNAYISVIELLLNNNS